jgi:hypothetical protein
MGLEKILKISLIALMLNPINLRAATQFQVDKLKARMNNLKPYASCMYDNYTEPATSYFLPLSSGIKNTTVFYQISQETEREVIGITSSNVSLSPLGTNMTFMATESCLPDSVYYQFMSGPNASMNYAQGACGVSMLDLSDKRETTKEDSAFFDNVIDDALRKFNPKK